MINDYRKMISDTLPFNRQSLLEKLKELKIESVGINYNGCGDSGGTESITTNPLLKIDELEQHKVTWQGPEHVETENGYQYLLVTKPISLNDAINHVAMDWVNSLYPGWEINDGAYGDIEILVNSGEVTLTHTEYFTETYTHEHVM